MNRLVLITCEVDRAKDWMRRSGLREEDVIIVTEARQVHGLEGIRRNPECGLLAVYTGDWLGTYNGWRLLEMLKAQGFNGPFDGG